MCEFAFGYLVGGCQQDIDTYWNRCMLRRTTHRNGSESGLNGIVHSRGLLLRECACRFSWLGLCRMTGCGAALPVASFFAFRSSLAARHTHPPGSRARGVACREGHCRARQPPCQARRDEGGDAGRQVQPRGDAEATSHSQSGWGGRLGNVQTMRLLCRAGVAAAILAQASVSPPPTTHRGSARGARCRSCGGCA